MKKNFGYYLFLFLSMAILGWHLEALYMLIVNHRIVNGGFLLGPWTPIYGWGCLMIALVFKNDKSNNLIIFIKSIFYCSLLEYFTSYILENMFNKHWWNYYDFFLNINGRICLFSCLIWGILGLIFIKKIEPFIYKLYRKYDPNFIKIWLIITATIYVIDSIFSIIIRLP